MGIFDKVKSFATKLTGGSAKVFVESDPIKFGEPFTVRIKAIVKEEAISIDRVYLNIEGLEEVRINHVGVHHNHQGNSQTSTQNIYETHRTYQNQITVQDKMNLASTMTYDWITEIELPSSAQPVYLGKYARHTYRIKAGLDMPGNDPDSGWVELQ